MNKASLKEVFDKARDLESDVFLELTVPGSDYTEIIVVRFQNLDLKWNYYNENYDDELKLKRCDKIRIIGAVMKRFIG